MPLLFVDLCKESNIPVVLVHPLIITVLQRIRATKVSDIEAFLSMECQLEWIGDYSRQHQERKKQWEEEDNKERLEATTTEK